MSNSVSLPAKNRVKNFSIRQMEAGDIPHIAKLDAISNNPPWTFQSFEKEISLSFSISIIAASNESEHSSSREDSLLGFAVMWIVSEVAQLNRIAVAPDSRRKGIGESLARHLFDTARKQNCTQMELEVCDRNSAAISLYKKLGFKLSGRRKNFYPDGDALLMVCDLS